MCRGLFLRFFKGIFLTSLVLVHQGRILPEISNFIILYYYTKCLQICGKWYFYVEPVLTVLQLTEIWNLSWIGRVIEPVILQPHDNYSIPWELRAHLGVVSLAQDGWCCHTQLWLILVSGLEASLVIYLCTSGILTPDGFFLSDFGFSLKLPFHFTWHRCF